MKKKFDKAKQSASRLIVKLNPGRRSRSRSPHSADPDPSMSTSAPSADVQRYADPKAPQTVAGTAGSIVTEFLAAARDGADLCLPLKAALVGAVKIIEICQRTAEVSDQYQQLGSRLAHLGAVTEALSKRSHLDPNLMQRLNSIAESFLRLTACIEAKQERATVRRVLESQADVAEVKEIILKISARIETFIYESMIRVEIGVDDILARLPSVEERELGKELKRWSEITQIIEKALGGRRVHDAAHDSQPRDAGCMQDTRVAVLCKFVGWAKNDPKNIFWLAGMAGTGKTSIAVSLCRMLQEDPDVLLAGTFFCSRTASNEAQSDPRRIIPTLAASLADQSPSFAAELAAELRPNAGAAAHKPTSEQMGPMLQRPLAALALETRPIVFVIDALDECSNEREMSTLLTAIATFTCPARVKFILTSRPETHILGSPISDRAQNEILQLHMIGQEEVTEDIRLYVERTFEQHPLADPDPEVWYSHSDVRALASLSSGLFIFASTAITYILDTDTVEGRSTRLQTVLSTMKNSKVATGPLDEVYEFVVARASSETKVEPEELARTRQVLACILTARMPLSIAILAELLDQKPNVLRSSLRRLRAVVNVPEEYNQPGLRTLHASFGDYLFERAAPNIRIARSLGDDAIARGCLRLMTQRLHFNVSRSTSSYEPNHLTKSELITPSLEYACMQWAYHVANLHESSTLDKVIYNTFRSRILFWVEVMSVLGQVQRAAAIMITAAATVHSTELSLLFRDANSFIASSREAIERSASHIYISALPFAPKDSLIYQTYFPLCTGLVSVDTHGIDRHAGWLVMTLTGHESSVHSVAYSPDGQFLGSGSADGSVRIWETRTGEETMSPLRSGDGEIYSVAFSPDGENIASGTQAGAVCIWNLGAGLVSPRKLIGHSGKIKSVAYSPDGLRLASASTDRTVRLWDTATGQRIKVVDGRDVRYVAVAFSPDGQYLVCNSDAHIIQSYDGTSGEAVDKPHPSHPSHLSYYTSFSFSPDSKTLASSSPGGDIRVWDLQTGACIPILQGHSIHAGSIRFAPDGRRLVSTSYDNTVRLWTLQDGVAEAASIVLGRHADWAHSATFSPDGLYVASAGKDRTICVWNSGSVQLVSQPLPGHDDAVRSVALSSDGALLISASNDTSIRVWSTQSGQPSLAPLVGHGGTVSSAVMSSDQRLIASSSWDCTVRLWNGQTGAAIGKPLQTHTNWFREVAFSPDTRWLASASENNAVFVWNVALGQQASFSPLDCKDPVYTVNFSPDGQLIAAGDFVGRIHLWTSETGLPVYQPLQAHDNTVHSIMFSPDSSRIVSGADDATLRIWNVSTGRRLFTLEGHISAVSSTAYSTDGRYIVSGSADKSIRLWNAVTGTPIFVLHGHSKVVSSVALTPDGRSIVSSSSDHTIRVWDVEAVLSMSSSKTTSPIEALTSTGLVDGWILGPSKELLLWVPPDYRAHIHVPPCSNIISRHRIVIEGDSGGLHAGKRWTSCWGNTILKNVL